MRVYPNGILFYTPAARNNLTKHSSTPLPYGKIVPACPLISEKTGFLPLFVKTADKNARRLSHTYAYPVLDARGSVVCGF